MHSILESEANRKVPPTKFMNNKMASKIVCKFEPAATRWKKSLGKDQVLITYFTTRVNPALFTQTLYLSAVCLVWKKVSGSVYSVVAHPSSTQILKGRGEKKTCYSTSMYVCKDGEEEVSNNVLFPLAK